MRKYEIPRVLGFLKLTSCRLSGNFIRETTQNLREIRDELLHNLRDLLTEELEPAMREYITQELKEEGWRNLKLTVLKKLKPAVQEVLNGQMEPIRQQFADELAKRLEHVTERCVKNLDRAFSRIKGIESEVPDSDTSEMTPMEGSPSMMDLQQRMLRLEGGAQEAQQRLSELEAADSEKQAKIHEMEAQIDKLESDKRSLQAQLEELQGELPRNQSRKSILKLPTPEQVESRRIAFQVDQIATRLAAIEAHRAQLPSEPVDSTGVATPKVTLDSDGSDLASKTSRRVSFHEDDSVNPTAEITRAPAIEHRDGKDVAIEESSPRLSEPPENDGPRAHYGMGYPIPKS